MASSGSPTEPCRSGVGIERYANRTSFAPETIPPSAINAAKHHKKYRIINDRIPFPTAHNGLVAGSSPAGPTKNISTLLGLRCPRRDHRTRNRTRYVHFSFARKFEGVGRTRVLVSGYDTASTILAFPANGEGLTGGRRFHAVGRAASCYLSECRGQQKNGHGDASRRFRCAVL